MAFRTVIPDFQLANPIYVAARVSFYTVDINGARTDTLATVYSDPLSSALAQNPQTLDGEGKFFAPVYIGTPVIAEVVGSTVGTHSTGVINPRGTWRGDWTTGTSYYVTDFVQDSATKDIYVTADDFVSSATLTADVTAGHLVLAYANPAQLSAEEADDAATLAEGWATLIDAFVTETSLSAKEWAVGQWKRGVAGFGSARDWASYVGGTVDNLYFSARQYAINAAASDASAAAHDENAGVSAVTAAAAAATAVDAAAAAATPNMVAAYYAARVLA